MADASTPSPPVRLCAICLLLWCALIVAIGIAFHLDGESWPWVAYVLAAGTAFIAVRGLRRGQWLEPLFGALYLLAVACVAAGPMTDSDTFAAVGICSLVLLTIGYAVVHRLGEIAEALRERPPG